MVRFFTESPDQLALVLEDPPLWDESARSAIVLHLLGTSVRASELTGIKIPAQRNIWVAVAAAKADPGKLTDPLRSTSSRERC